MRIAVSDAPQIIKHTSASGTTMQSKHDLASLLKVNRAVLVKWLM